MDNSALPSDTSVPSPTPKPARRTGWWIHVLIIAAYPVVAGVLSSLRGTSDGAALSGSSRGLLIVCGMHLLMFGLIFGLALVASRASWDDLLLRWRPGWWVVPLGVVYSVALRIVLGIIAAIAVGVLVATGVITPQSLAQFEANNRPKFEAIVDISALRDNPIYFWLTVTLVSFVVAGLTEELWRSAFLGGLRALWPKCFGTRLGQIGAVAIASISFGVGHLGQGWMAVGLAALLGIGLGTIMVLHRSIWPAVIAHGVFDATTFGLLPWVMEQLKQAL